ncbi:hypothetical protein D3C81_1262260 [compost metagenome]
MLEHRARLVTHGADQAAINGQLREPGHEGIVHCLKDGLLASHRKVETVLACLPDGIKSVQLRQIKVIIHIANRARHMSHPWHDVPGGRLHCPGPTTAHREHPGRPDGNHGLGLGRKAVAALDIDHHDRDAFVPARYTLNAPAQAVPLHAILLVRCRRLLANTAHAHLGAHCGRDGDLPGKPHLIG